MAALEDTLKKIYGLPESTTPTMPRTPSLRRETGHTANGARRYATKHWFFKPS